MAGWTRIRLAAQNLIHVDDAAAVILAAESRARPPCTYVVSDGHPADRRAFYRRLADVVGAPDPRFGDLPGAHPDIEGRGRGSKRVSNRRMLADLQVNLSYPSYCDGLSDFAAYAGYSFNAGCKDCRCS
jgi:nucleoside-diphosphate-sugar epimerase